MSSRVIFNPGPGRPKKPHLGSELIDTTQIASGLQAYLLLKVISDEGINSATDKHGGRLAASKQVAEIISLIKPTYVFHIARLYPTIKTFVDLGWLHEADDGTYEITSQGSKALQHAQNQARVIIRLLGDSL